MSTSQEPSASLYDIHPLSKIHCASQICGVTLPVNLRMKE